MPKHLLKIMAQECKKSFSGRRAWLRNVAALNVTATRTSKKQQVCTFLCRFARLKSEGVYQVVIFVPASRNAPCCWGEGEGGPLRDETKTAAGETSEEEASIPI